jgi:hypothetical protein
MGNTRHISVERSSDEKPFLVTLKLQRDLYEWIVHEARERRASLSYVVRDALHKAKAAQEKGAQ